MQQFLQRLLLILLCCSCSVGFLQAGSVTNRYVVKNNPNAQSPYDGWDNAAPDIQTAIDTAVAGNGDSVIVAPGIYDSGTTWAASNTNRVYLSKAITLISRDNDPATTIIQGTWDGVSTNDPKSVRCVSMVNGAQLIGFTLTNGATTSVGAYDGGGILCSGLESIVSNCVISGCSARYGGGVYSGTLYDCHVEGNRAYRGGGSYITVLYNCVVRGNEALYGVDANRRGGGVLGGSAYNCLIEGNTSINSGGARDATLYNCTIVNNIAGSSPGTRNCTLWNCISWNNVDNVDTKTYYSRGDGSQYLSNNCTQADPLFTDTANGDWHLRGNSPCRDTGTNLVWMATARDLDGRSRLFGAPDMGCYEYLPHGTLITLR